MPSIVDSQNTNGEKFRQCFFCSSGDEVAVTAILSEANRHPEQSEGSAVLLAKQQILRFAQDDEHFAQDDERLARDDDRFAQDDTRSGREERRSRSAHTL